MKDLIEELRDVFVTAWKKAFNEDADIGAAELAGIEAVLSALAAKGAEELPSAKAMLKAGYDAALKDDSNGKYFVCTAAINGARAMLVECIAPILAAKDAERDAHRSAARLAQGRLSELHGALAAALVDTSASGALADIKALREAGAKMRDLFEGAAKERAMAWDEARAANFERDALRARVVELEAAILDTPQGCMCKPSSGCQRALLREVAERGRSNDGRG